MKHHRSLKYTGVQTYFLGWILNIWRISDEPIWWLFLKLRGVSVALQLNYELYFHHHVLFVMPWLLNCCSLSCLFVFMWLLMKFYRFLLMKHFFLVYQPKTLGINRCWELCEQSSVKALWGLRFLYIFLGKWDWDSLWSVSCSSLCCDSASVGQHYSFYYLFFALRVSAQHQA